MNWKIILVVVILSVSGGLLYSKLKKPSTPSESAEMSEHKHDEKEVWTCPMHPQIRKDGPGQCPICGMDLVKVGKEAAGENQSAEVINTHAPFKLSLDRQQMIGVKLGMVEKKKLFKSIKAAGRVAYDPDLYTAQTEYQEALRQYSAVKDSPVGDVRHSAERMVQSAKLRLKLLGLSDQQIRSLGKKSNSDQSLLLHQEGEDVYIYAEIYEMDIPDVEPGLSAEISASFLGGKKLAGKVASVDRVLNPQTRTAKARILIPKARTQLKPESYVDVTILADQGEQLTIPMDAVLDTGTQAITFVKKEDGTFEPRNITIRFRSGDKVAIESGLKEGESIVTSANFLIDSESRLKAVMSGTSNTSGEAKPKATPSCPPGQFWHAEMNHCMQKTGE